MKWHVICFVAGIKNRKIERNIYSVVVIKERQKILFEALIVLDLVESS